MILIINICKEKLHYLEFVKPITDILDINKIKYFIKDYKLVNEEDLKKADKIIICGTSLFDNEFVNNIKYFKWINDFQKSLFGICGGMQVIGVIFGGKVKKETEIGYYNEFFHKEFLGFRGNLEVYHLHNNYINFDRLKYFEVFNRGEISQAVKHKDKEIYGVLFHPEVRQKKMINHFLGL